MASDREKLRQLEANFDAYIGPLLDENDLEDNSMAWEIRKFLHQKRLKMLTAEKESFRKWKEILLRR